MDEIFKLPMEIAALLAGGTTAVVSAIKGLANGKGKEIPSHWKLPMVGVVAFLGSLMWFQAKNSLSWSNWVDILATTAATVFLAVLWHTAQRPKNDPRRG